MSDSMPQQYRVGVLGATSFVGENLIQCLTHNGCDVIAFSRKDVSANTTHVEWKRLDEASSEVMRNATKENIPFWVCLAPISVLSEHIALLEAYGVRRIVALSSTSRFTKQDSSDQDEQRWASQLIQGEEQLEAWAQGRGVEWIILRPTLIYGYGGDKNISEIARFIRRFGFFPSFGKAQGLRQPIHVNDVALACLFTLQMSVLHNRAYTISGEEVLTYREMVSRIFSVLDKTPRFVEIPLWLFSVAVRILRCFPRYRTWTTAMAERMNRDMVFDHQDAERDFGFTPSGFMLTSNDIPSK